MMITALLTSLMMLVCGMPRTAATETARTDDFQERDEINQTYQLAPGARVEVSSIRGPVEIVNGDGAMAQVQIVRTARTRADLAHHKIDVQLTGNSLVVRGIQEPEDVQRRNIQVNHHVILKLPRTIDLAVSSISGPVKVADVDGQTRVNSISGPTTIGNVGAKLQVNSISGSLDVGNVGADARLNSISGNVDIGQVNGALDVLSVSGGLKATVTSLGPQGVHIKSVSGSIEIGFQNDVNADFSAQGVSGRVYFDVPNVTRDSEEENRPNVRARIGSGGTPISIQSVSGNIRLKRFMP